jgi:hypothetical protein
MAGFVWLGLAGSGSAWIWLDLDLAGPGSLVFGFLGLSLLWLSS